MATLNNIINLSVQYTKTIDNLNNKLNNTNVSAGKVSKGLGKLFDTMVNVESIQKVLNISDEMSRATASLNLVNDGLQTNKQLQNMVFESAQRSRQSYTSMADIVAELGQGARSAFSNNQETIAFAETLNKMFVIAGSSQEEMSSASLQMTKALGSGVLSSEEFNEVFKSAPNVMQAVADYMNVPIDKLGDMASEGAITSNIIKNALFAAADETSTKLEDMPMTFSQAWTSIQNSLMQTFQPLLEIIAKGAQLIGDNWNDIAPIFYGAATAVGAYVIGLKIMEIASTAANIAQKGLKASLMANPLMWIAVLIGVVVALIYKWVQSVGGIQIAWQIAMNTLLTAWDWFKIGMMTGGYAILNFLDTMTMTFMCASVRVQNFVGDMKAGVLSLLQEMVNGAIGIINSFITALNNIKGVTIEPVEAVTFGTNAQLQNDAEKQIRNLKLNRYISSIDAKKTDRDSKLIQMKSDAISATAQRQANITSAQATAFNTNSDNPFSTDTGTLNNPFSTDTGTLNNPLTVEGTGSGGKVDVDMEDEDLQYLRDIAERDYINQFSTASLAPNVQFTFGDVHEEADANKVAGRIQKILAEEIAMVAEGVY